MLLSKIGPSGKFVLPWLAPIVLLGVTGCSQMVVGGIQARQTGMEAAGRFQQQFNAMQFEQIYKEADSAFQNSQPKEKLLEFFEKVHKKLGPIEKRAEPSYVVNFTTSGNFVRLVYETQFSKGKGTESFNFRIQDKQAKLVGYEINSNDLIGN